MRIAFLTPEFVTHHASGGVANYLNRIATLLVAVGHEVEIFTNAAPARSFLHNGLFVHHVPSLPPSRSLGLAWRLANLARMNRRCAPLLLWLPRAQAFAKAVEERHLQSPFDIIQSSDFCAPGLLVKRRKGRTHIVRSSGAFDLFSPLDGEAPARVRTWLERRALRKADRAYAPSRCVADHFKQVHGIALEVVRPPFALEVQPSAEPPFPLPPRFFLHFGQLTRRKGSVHLAQALPAVWRACPDFQMIWAGALSASFQQCGKALLPAHDPRLIVVPPLSKPQLYSIVQRAGAAVLPSLTDNLPNTVIESLMLGTPVIAFRGASIDELVAPGETGELVPMQDVDALAEVLIRWWKAQPIARGFTWNSPIAHEMSPPMALQKLLDFARGGQEFKRIRLGRIRRFRHPAPGKTPLAQ